MINVVHTEYTDAASTEVKVVCERSINKDVKAEDVKEIREMLNFVFGFERLTQEKMVAIFVDSKLAVKNIQLVAIGFVNGILCSTRDILVTALNTGASGIILAHNHPSGDPTPSKQDNQFTADMKRAADVCGLKLIEHLICGNGTYYSYYEQGGI